MRRKDYENIGDALINSFQELDLNEQQRTHITQNIAHEFKHDNERFNYEQFYDYITKHSDKTLDL